MYWNLKIMIKLKKSITWIGSCTLWCQWNAIRHILDWNSASGAGSLTRLQCVICAGGHSHKDCPKKMEAWNDPTKLKCAKCGESGHPASYCGCESFKKAFENYEKPKNKQTENIPKPRSFNSNKVTEGFFYSSALTNKNQTMTPNPAQNRLNTVQTRTQPNPGNSCNMEQMLQNISPMLNSVENSMEKFMLLSKPFEVCFSRNGWVHE